MSRALLVLNSMSEREKAARWIAAAPTGTRVEFKGPKRTLPQNDLLWVNLTAVAEQLLWHGQKYTADDWKDFFMHALRQARWMPAEDGAGMVPIGLRSSDLAKDEMSELIDLVHAFMARNGVTLPERDEVAA